MPRPESPEGPWVTVPVRVRKSLLARIDVVRGERNRSEWGRAAMEAAADGAAFVPAAAERERPHAEFEERRAEREMAEGYVPPEVPQSPPKRPRKRAAAAPRTVTPAAPGVPPTAFQEPAEPAPVRLRRPEGVPLDATGQPCTHPKGRRSKGLCGACGTYVGAS